MKIEDLNVFIEAAAVAKRLYSAALKENREKEKENALTHLLSICRNHELNFQMEYCEASNTFDIRLYGQAPKQDFFVKKTDLSLGVYLLEEMLNETL